MPRKISQAEVVNQLYKEYVDNKLNLDLVNYTQPYIPINFANFERALMKDEFVTSATTIRQKWKGLIASEIILQTGHDNGKINVMLFRTMLYLNRNLSHTHIIHTQNTHTEHTQTAEGGSE